MSDPAVVRLPPRFLASLSDRCGRAGPEAASALREAGRELGEDLLEELAGGQEPAETAPAIFWEAVANLLAERGLGDLDVEVRTASLAELRLERGPEVTAREEGERIGPDCPFSTGLLAGLLTAAADEAVAVLPVGSAADDDGTCRWLAGAEESLERVRHRLAEGASVREALEAS